MLVYGRYPIPQSTQKLCDYWIFDKSNPVLDGRLMDFWNINNGKKTHKLNNDLYIQVHYNYEVNPYFFLNIFSNQSHREFVLTNA